MDPHTNHQREQGQVYLADAGSILADVGSSVLEWDGEVVINASVAATETAGEAIITVASTTAEVAGAAGELGFGVLDVIFGLLSAA